MRVSSLSIFASSYFSIFTFLLFCQCSHNAFSGYAFCVCGYVSVSASVSVLTVNSFLHSSSGRNFVERTGMACPIGYITT